MKWKRKTERIVKRFALFPIKAEEDYNNRDEDWRWLETVYLYQTSSWPFWFTWKFVTKEDYDVYISKIKKENKSNEINRPEI